MLGRTLLLLLRLFLDLPCEISLWNLSFYSLNDLGGVIRGLLACHR